MRRIFRVAIITAVLLVTACASGKQEAKGPLTPMPNEQSMFKDPSNDLFMKAVNEYVASRGGPGNSHFEFTRVDLDGDGRREGIALMKSPHQFWCGYDGCSMIVFKAANSHFELVSEIAPVRGPLVISDHKSQGWKDIVVRVSGRTGFGAKDVALRYNGQSYPNQPAFEPALETVLASYEVSGIKIFP